VANEAYAAPVDLASGRQIIKRNVKIMENFSQQRLSNHKTACKLIVLRLPRYFAPVSFFKRNSIRRNHDVAAFGKLHAICLVWVAGETDDFTLSQIKLSSMLMMSKDRRYWSGYIFWDKDKRLDALELFDSIFNGLADVGATIDLIQYHRIQRTRDGRWSDQVDQVLAVH